MRINGNNIRSYYDSGDGKGSIVNVDGFPYPLYTEESPEQIDSMIYYEQRELAKLYREQ
jgi:hypothetical protein